MPKQSQISVKKLTAMAKLPEYAHPGDSGMDVYSVEEFTLRPGERKIISTGLQLTYLPVGYEIQVRSKSGIALKYGVTVLNSPGTIDSGYRGEIKVILINHSDILYVGKKGQKIAQLVVQAVERFAVIEDHGVVESSRGEGGFGSTGV